MTRTAPARARMHPADLGAGLLVALVVLLHAHFAAVDVRMAVDLGHYYRGAVEAARAAGLDGSVRWGFAEPGYGWLLAALWGWLPPSQGGFEAVQGLWMAALAVGMCLAGRALGGPRGGLVATAAVAFFPIFPVAARTHWIHHPEVAAGALGLGLVLSMPPRAWVGIAAGIALGLGATVRPSAPIWLAVPVAAWVIQVGPRQWRVWAPCLGGWALGTLSQAPVLLSYLDLRVANRGANAAAVGDLLPLLPLQTGLLPGLAALILAAMGLAALVRGDRVQRVGAAAALAWLAGGAAVLAISKAGPSNVPTAFAGLAILAALGAPSLPRRLATGGAVLAAALAVLGPGTQLVPALGALHPITGWGGHDHAQNWLVPRDHGLAAERLRAAAAAACPPDRQPRPVPAHGPPCRIIASAGLVHPSWEDDGGLGFFLAGIDGLQVYPAPGLVDRRPFQAAVDIRCEGPVPDPSGRFPGYLHAFEAAREGMEERAVVEGNGCVQRWYGPRR